MQWIMFQGGDPGLREPNLLQWAVSVPALSPEGDTRSSQAVCQHPRKDSMERRTARKPLFTRYAETKETHGVLSPRSLINS